MSGEKKHLQVLFIEDSEDDFFFTKRHIEECGFTIDASRVYTAKDLTTSLKAREWDIIICDYNLNGFTALDALEILHECDSDIPVIVLSGMLSGKIGNDIAVELMNAGAHDYIQKTTLNRLEPIIVREMKALEYRASMQLKQSRLKTSNKKLKKANKKLKKRLSEISDAPQ